MRRGLGLGLARNRGNSFARYDDFLLRDDFLTDEAAPLASPRSCEPGPGSFAVSDSTFGISIYNGILELSNDGTAKYIISNTAYAHSPGRAVVTKSKQSGSNARFGFGSSFSGPKGTVMYPGFKNIVGASVDVEDLPTTAYSINAVVRMESGGSLLVRDGVLLWVDPVSVLTSDLYIYAYTTNSGLYHDFIRLVDLGSPWDTDFGIATDRLAGARLAGDTFTHEADCLIEFEIPAILAAIYFRFRVQDSDNCWFIQILVSGNLVLWERVGASNISRATAAGVLSGGERIVIICDDETINCYYDNSLAWSYSSAANFKTEPNGELNAGVVSDIVTWPRVLSGAALTELLKFTT